MWYVLKNIQIASKFRFSLLRIRVYIFQIEKNIWVSCLETENFNVTLEYDTHIGFPSYYFPYANQKGYLSPFVAMQVDNLPGRIDIFRWYFSVE